MKYFKDTSNNVYAYDPDQIDLGYPLEPMVELTSEELELHLHPLATVEELAVIARAWRDSELARADVELNKVQDGMGVGTVTQWRAYRVALRNWPTTDGWPESTKPVSPDYKE